MQQKINLIPYVKRYALRREHDAPAHNCFRTEEPGFPEYEYCEICNAPYNSKKI